MAVVPYAFLWKTPWQRLANWRSANMMRCSEAEAQRFRIEVLKCRKSFVYFCDTYCQILSDHGQGGTWVPFASGAPRSRPSTRSTATA